MSFGQTSVGGLPDIFFIAEYRLQAESAGEEKPISYGFRLERFELSGETSLELSIGSISLGGNSDFQLYRLTISPTKDTAEAIVRGSLSNNLVISSFETMPQPFSAHLEPVLAHDRLKAPLTITRTGAHYAVAYWAVPESFVYSTNINLAEGYTPEELVEALRAQEYGTIYILSIVPN